MSQQLVRIEKGYDLCTLNSTNDGRLLLTNARNSTEMAGVRSVSIYLNEQDAREICAALAIYIDSRETKFNVGDIVYEPTHYKRAAEVIEILADRVMYGAPYRIRFIDQAEGQPPTDYFPADGLVLVQRKAEDES